MKDFITKLLREELNSEPLDLSKVKVSKRLTNGLLTYLPIYDGERMGSFRLEPTADGYSVFGTVLYDRFKNKGFGYKMYLYIINQLKKEGKYLYSDKFQSEDALRVWDRLVKNGFAEKEGNLFKSKI
jgi:GNAT superfamily N-acetyltransferase